VLWTVTRASSSADLDWAGRKRLIAHLTKLQRNQEKQADVSIRIAINNDRMLRKCRALWINLRKAGALKDGSDRALVVWLLKRTGLSHIRFLQEAVVISSCIEALKIWLRDVQSGARQPGKSSNE
jgi:Protein of unknown function (DUF1018)